MVSEELSREKRKVLFLTELVFSSEDRTSVFSRAMDGHYFQAEIGDYVVDSSLAGGSTKPVFVKTVTCMRHLPTGLKDAFVLKRPDNKYGLYRGKFLNEPYS